MEHKITAENRQRKCFGVLFSVCFDVTQLAQCGFSYGV